MDKPMMAKMGALNKAMKDLIAAHDNIAKGLAVHAETHDGRLRQMRKHLAEARKIERGIARHNAT